MRYNKHRWMINVSNYHSKVSGKKMKKLQYVNVTDKNKVKVSNN